MNDKLNLDDLPSGVLTITVQGVDHTFDLLLLSEHIDEVLARHEDRRDQPRAWAEAFYPDLVAKFRELGLPDMPPAHAEKIRETVYRQVNALKNASGEKPS